MLVIEPLLALPTLLVLHRSPLKVNVNNQSQLLLVIDRYRLFLNDIGCEVLPSSFGYFFAISMVAQKCNKCHNKIEVGIYVFY